MTGATQSCSETESPVISRGGMAMYFALNSEMDRSMNDSAEDDIRIIERSDEHHASCCVDAPSGWGHQWPPT